MDYTQDVHLVNQEIPNEVEEKPKKKTQPEPKQTLPMVGIHQALVAAKKVMRPVLKTAENKGFQGSKYATLQDTLEAVEDALLENDIALTQTFRIGHYSNDRILVTRLTHGPSKEYIESEMVVFAPYFADPRKKTGEEDGRETRDPQAIGSAITYYRRYALQAICGVAPEDDDGNAAARPKDTAATPVPNVVVGPNASRLRDAMRAKGATTVAQGKEILQKVGYTGNIGDVTESEALTLIQAVQALK